MKGDGYYYGHLIYRADALMAGQPRKFGQLAEWLKAAGCNPAL